MPFQIIINIIISIMWMFLSETYTVVSFLSGYLLGILLLFLLRRFIPGRFYIVTLFKIIKLILIFTRELISSNIAIVKLVYQRAPVYEPGIFALPTDLKTDWEITLLANLITLTPGSLSVSISDDQSKIYVHAMDIDEVEKSIVDIKNTFEKAIMEVTR